jgi:hypothetical protein
MRVFIQFFILCVIASSCNNPERMSPQEMQHRIYIDGRISGEADQETVNCLLQFKKGGPEGKTILLKEPGKVTLDGEVVHPDSAGLSGIVYETAKAMIGFRGKHQLVYTDEAEKQRVVSFDFIPFDLDGDIPGRIKKTSFALSLKDFPESETPVRFMLTDTAFATNDLNEIIVVKKRKLLIDAQMLNKLKAGPVSLQIIREEVKVVKDGKNEIGRLVTSYGLRKEFELVD